MPGFKVNRRKPSQEYFTLMQELYNRSEDTIRSLGEDYNVSSTYVHETIRGNFTSMTAKRIRLLEALEVRYNNTKAETLIRVVQLSNGFLLQGEKLTFFSTMDELINTIPESATILFDRVEDLSMIVREEISNGKEKRKYTKKILKE